MRLRLAIVATVLLLCAPAALHAASLSWNRLDASIAFAFSPSSNAQSRILVIGDKLVEDGTKQNLGWVSQLKGAYGDSVELYSLGSNLANTEAADSALASLLATPKGSAAFSKVMLVVLAFGSNELHAAHSDVQQPWVSPKGFEQHLGSMVRQLQARGDLKLLLVQPPPLQSMQEAAPYAEAVAAVAKQYDVPYVDTLTAIAKTPAWKTEVFKNGDQMSQLGHDILFGRIGTEIKRQLPTVSPQAMVQRAQASSAAAAAAAVVSTAAVPSSADDAAPTAAAAAVGGRRHRRGGRAQPAAAVVHSIRRPRGPAVSSVSTAAVVAPALTLDQIVRGRFPTQGNMPQDVKPVEYHDPDAGLPRVNDLLHRAKAHSEPEEPATISSSSSSGRPASRWGDLDFVSKAINDELDNVPLNPPAAKPVTGTTSSSADSTLVAEPMQQKATTTAAGSWQNNVPEPSEELPVWFTKVPEPAAKDAKLMVIPEPHLVNLLPKAAAAVAAIQSADPSAEAAVPTEAAPVPAAAAAAAAPTWASQVPEPSDAAPTWMAAVAEPNKAAAAAAAAPAAGADSAASSDSKDEQPAAAAAAAAAPAAWYANVPEPSNTAPAWQASVAEPSPAKYAALMQAREQAQHQEPAASKPLDPAEGEPQAVETVSASAADTWGKHVPEPVATVPTWFSAVPEPTKRGSDSTEKPAAAVPAAAADVPKPAAAEEPAAAEQPAVKEAPKASADKPTEQKPATVTEQPAAKDVDAPKPAAAADKPVSQEPPKLAEQKPMAAEQPAATEAPKPAAEKPSEADAPKAADKPAVDAQQPAQQQPAVADKPAAEVPKAAELKPAAAAEPSNPAADAAKPAEQQPAVADKPAAELPRAAEQQSTAADKPLVGDVPKAAEQKPTAAAGEVPKTAADKPAQQTDKPAEKPAEATSAPKVDAGKPVVPDQKPASKETPKAAGDKPADKPAEEKPADKQAAVKDAPKPAADKSDKPAEQQQVQQKPVAVVAPPRAAEQKPADKPANNPAAPADAAKPTEQKPAATADKVPADKPAATFDSPKTAGEQKPADKPADKPAEESKSAAPTDSAEKPQDTHAAEKVHEVNLPPALKKWQSKVDFERPAVKAPEQKLSYRPVARKIAPNAPIAKPKNRAASYLQKLKPKWWSTAFEEDKSADQEVQAVRDGAQTFTHTPGAIDKLNPNPQALMYPVNAQPTDSKALDSLVTRTPNLPSAEPTVLLTGPAAEADLEAKPTLLAPATTTPAAAKDGPSATSGTFGSSSGAVRAVPKTPATPAQQLPLAQQPAKGTFSSGPQIPTPQQPTAQAPKLTNKPAPDADTAPVADMPMGADGAEPVIPGALKQSPTAPKDAAAAVPSTPTFGATAPAADAAQGAAGAQDAKDATAADKLQEPAPTPQDTFAPTTQMPASPALAPAPAADKPQGADAADKSAAAPGTFGAKSGNTFAPVPAAAEPKHVGQAAGKKDMSGAVKPKGGQHPDDADVLLQNGDVQGEVQKSKDTPKDSYSKDTKEEEYEQYPKQHHKDHKAEDKYGHDDPDLHNTLDKPAKKAPKHKEPHKEKDPHKDKPNKNKPQKKHHHPKHPTKGHKHGPEEVPYTEEHMPEPYGHTPDTPYRPDGPGYPHDHPHDDGYHPEHPSFYREEHDAPYQHKHHDEEPYPAHFNADDRAMPLADPSRVAPPEQEMKSKDIDRAVSAEEDPSKPLIVTLGDYVMRQGSFGTGIVTASTEAPGWISRLAAAYGDKAQVVNRGQATATSPDGVEMVRALLTDYLNAGERIKLVVLSFGGNDAITRSGDKATKVALADYKENMMTMVAELRKAGVTNILLLTPPPAARRSDRRFKTVKDYAKASTEAAKAMNVPTVDLFSAVSSLKDWQASAMNEDGLRLSERGQQLLFKRVMKVLNNQQLQHVSPAKLQPQAVSQ